MSKIYKIEKDTIIECLDDIEKFLLTIERIQKDKNIEYTYQLEINPLKNPKRWEVELTLKQNEEIEIS